MPRLQYFPTPHAPSALPLATGTNPGGATVGVAEPGPHHIPVPEHGAAVADTDPCAQKYPAVQSPEQPTVESPVTLPNDPAGHSRATPLLHHEPSGHATCIVLSADAKNPTPASAGAPL